MKIALVLLWFFNVIALAIGSEDASDPLRKASKPIWNETYADLLKRDLLMTYDKFARPTQPGNTTNVMVDLQLKHLDFDESTSVFSIYAWFSMQWVDEKLKWNETSYGNLSKLVLAQHEIWEPDIRSYNALNIDSFSANFNFYVNSTGMVTWIPPAIFKVLCDSNLRYWPYDSHKCEIVLGSWVHDGDELNLYARQPHTELELYTENPEWEVSEFSVGRVVSTYACCPEPYISVRYNISIARRASIYHHVIVAPSFVIMILALITFWLPATYGEKILLNGVTIVMIVLFLLYFSQKLNIMATYTPLIVLFYCHSLYLVCFSTMISVIVINLTRMKSHRALPWLVKKQLDGKLGDYLLLDYIADIEIESQPRASELHPFEEQNQNDDHQLIQVNQRSKVSLKNDYIRLATAIDRIAFICYLTLFVFFTFLYSL